MVKTILITGATGFIGSHLLPLLLENKYQLIIVKRSSSDTWRINNLLKKLTIFDLDSVDLETIFKKYKIDCLVHLAAKYIKKHQNITDVQQILESNVVFPSLLCDLCVKYNVKHLINTGTFFEYKISDKPLNEESKVQPYNLYSASKLAFNEILKYYSEYYNLQIINLRLFAPFGEKDNEKLIPFLIKTLIKGEKIDFSPGEQKWNFTYVKDIVEAYLSVLKRLGKLAKFDTFNIGYDKAYAIKDVVKKIESISKTKKNNINWGAKPYIENEIFYANCDNSKARKLLGWKPKFDINSGLRATYKYYLDKNKEENE